MVVRQAWCLRSAVYWALRALPWMSSGAEQSNRGSNNGKATPGLKVVGNQAKKQDESVTRQGTQKMKWAFSISPPNWRLNYTSNSGSFRRCHRVARKQSEVIWYILWLFTNIALFYWPFLDRKLNRHRHVKERSCRDILLIPPLAGRTSKTPR